MTMTHNELLAKLLDRKLLAPWQTNRKLKNANAVNFLELECKVKGVLQVKAMPRREKVADKKPAKDSSGIPEPVPVPEPLPVPV